MTTRRLASKQPSFKESVIAHWSRQAGPRRKCTGAQATHRSCGCRSSHDDDVVAERSVSLRRMPVRSSGGIGSENADMSSDKECEKHSRRKSKGSCARLIRAG